MNLKLNQIDKKNSHIHVCARKKQIKQRGTIESLPGEYQTVCRNSDYFNTIQPV